MQDGYVEGLKGIGLGIEIDEGKVRDVAKRAEAWVSGGGLETMVG